MKDNMKSETENDALDALMAGLVHATNQSEVGDEEIDAFLNEKQSVSEEASAALEAH